MVFTNAAKHARMLIAVSDIRPNGALQRAMSEVTI
jgi:hypothetical protein